MQDDHVEVTITVDIFGKSFGTKTIIDGREGYISRNNNFYPKEFVEKLFKDLTPESLESDQYILDLWKEWEPKHDN